MFQVRGWTTRASDENSVTAVIKDKHGTECYKVVGKYTDQLVVRDLQSGYSWEIFNAPSKPKNYEQMFGMNLYALQLNVLSDSLKRKLPQTDSRFRPGRRAWERIDLDKATDEKNRLENNQRKRRK